MLHLLADIAPASGANSGGISWLALGGLTLILYGLFRGKTIIDPYGRKGTVVSEARSLDEALGFPPDKDVRHWLAIQRIKPQTPRDGIWYIVRYDEGGEGVIGGNDV